MLAVNVYQLLSSECVNRRSFSQKNDINIRLISVGEPEDEMRSSCVWTRQSTKYFSVVGSAAAVSFNPSTGVL